MIWDGWFSGLLRRRSQVTGGAPQANDDSRTWAEKGVSPDSTLQLSAAWACVRLNSRTIGYLPRKVYSGKRGAKDRRPAYDHALYALLHDSPNADQTSMEFWEGMATCLNLRGNAFAEKNYGAITGKLVGLTPLPVDDVRVYRASNGARRFKLSGSGFIDRDLGEKEVFHLRGFGAGGLTGLSPLHYGRQTFGTALAADETAGRTFQSGLQLAGFIEMETGVKLKDGQRDEIVAMFDKFAKSPRPGKFMPLDPGMKFAPLAMKPEDVQLLQTRAFHIEEIARWFGIPPVLIGHASAGQTMWGSGIEQIMLAWLTLSLGAELERIEQSIEKQLFTAEDRRDLFVEHNVEALLRADSAARAALYSTFAQNGISTRNEMRARENLPPLPGGEVLTVQSNLVPLDQLGKTPPRAVQPAPGEPVV